MGTQSMICWATLERNSMGLWIAWVSPAVRLWFCGGRGAGVHATAIVVTAARADAAVRDRTPRNQATENDDEWPQENPLRGSWRFLRVGSWSSRALSRSVRGGVDQLLSGLSNKSAAVQAVVDGRDNLAGNRAAYAARPMRILGASDARAHRARGRLASGSAIFPNTKVVCRCRLLAAG
jgi:hypothetical protein